MVRFITSINRGVTSLGFTITAAPASKAGRVSISDNNKGKFQGDITPINSYGTQSCCKRIKEIWVVFSGIGTKNSPASLHQRSMLLISNSISSFVSQTLPVSIIKASSKSFWWNRETRFQIVTTASADGVSSQSLRGNHRLCDLLSSKRELHFRLSHRQPTLSSRKHSIQAFKGPWMVFWKYRHAW